MSKQPGLLFDAPGPKARRNIWIVNIVGLVVILGIAWFIIDALNEKGQFTSEKWAPLAEWSTWENNYLPGIMATIRAAAVAIVLANIVGLVLGLGRLAQNPIVRGIAGTIVEFFRAVPVLVLMLFFNILFSRTLAPDGALFDQRDAPFLAVVVGLTLYNSAVIAELVRSGVHTLPGGQREAALAIGMPRGKSLRIVELPQALVAMMPAMVSQLVVILKDSSLGYLVSYSELLLNGRLVGTTNANLLPSLFVVACIFIILNLTLTTIAGALAKFLDPHTAARAKKHDPALTVEAD
ncbi:amino acid ABC transporter permease [Georgenia sp. Z1344]|uniref:amino acid ABC transporter permease n=1 Tax=Georgenia sp. Z1344 TaxID=3416706 RepID=UPI003CF2CD77